MSVGATVRIERAIMSVLSQPQLDPARPGLTGVRSTCSVTVKATGADVVLPANTYAFAVVTSAAGLAGADQHRLIKTIEAKTVTSAGVSVPIMSMAGGSDMNLPIGTVLRWDPQISGVEATSTLTSAMTGGLTLDEPGYVKRIVSLEGLGAGESARAFWAAQAPALFPAIVVAWESAGEAVRKGSGRQVQLHQFRIYVVTSRLENDMRRRHDGHTVLDAVREILCDRAEADGESFSNVPIQLGNMGRLALAPSSYVYWVDVIVSHSTTKRELRSFASWLKTREQLTATPRSGYDETDTLIVVDQSQDMTGA